MTQNIALAHGDILHEGFTKPIQELLSGAAPNFRVLVKTNTTLKIVAGTGDDQQSIAIDGRYRYRTTETTATLPGSLPNGEHPVYVTATDNDYAGPTEAPDKTTRTFGLEVKKSPETPSAAIWRLVGYVTVASEKITAFRQVVGSVNGPMIENGAFVNSATVTWNRDANGAWVAEVTGITGGSLSEEAAQSLFMSGDLKATGRSTVPTGWLLCDGAEVSRTGATKKLFEAIGTTYGVGNGSTTFNVPDARGRAIIGVDGSAGRLSENDALGKSGGTEKAKLKIENVPAHAHGVGTLAVASHKHSDGTLTAANHLHGVNINSGGNNVGHVHSAGIGGTKFQLTGGSVGGSGGGGLQQADFTGGENVGHFHNVNGNTAEATPDVTGETGAATPAVSGETGSKGTGTEPEHANMQPYLVANWMVKT